MSRRLKLNFVISDSFGFDFVFLIQLRSVDKEISLVELVKYRHNLDNIPTSHIKSILNGETNHKVLLLLDGYDEYLRGTNKDIDKAIESKLGNCFLILTSRPRLDFVGNDVRKRIDGEVVIKGFSVKSIIQYTVQYLQDDDLVNDFFYQASYGTATALLHIPILLLMLCAVFQEKEVTTQLKDRALQRHL